MTVDPCYEAKELLVTWLPFGLQIKYSEIFWFCDKKHMKGIITHQLK